MEESRRAEPGQISLRQVAERARPRGNRHVWLLGSSTPDKRGEEHPVHGKAAPG